MVAKLRQTREVVLHVARPTADTPASIQETRTRSLYELRQYVAHQDKRIEALEKEVAYLRKLIEELSENFTLPRSGVS